jgi:hypothetical protein
MKGERRREKGESTTSFVIRHLSFVKMGEFCRVRSTHRNTPCQSNLFQISLYGALRAPYELRLGVIE